MKPNSVRFSAVAEYQNGERLRDIAVRHGVSVGTVSLWAKQSGQRRRQQGCRSKSWPSEIDMQIVEAVKKVVDGHPTLQEIGNRFGGYSRANVHRIWVKWKDWTPKVPFEKGDHIRTLDAGFNSHDYEVVDPGVFGGLCRHLKTKKLVRINWVIYLTRGPKNARVRVSAVKTPKR